MIGIVTILLMGLMIFQNIGYAAEKPMEQGMIAANIDIKLGGFGYLSSEWQKRGNPPFHELLTCGDSRSEEHGDGGINIKFGNLDRNIDKYKDTCMAREVARGKNYTCQELYDSKDIWSLIRDNTIADGNFNYQNEFWKEEELTCKEGARKIDEDLERQAIEWEVKDIRDWKSDYVGARIGVEYFTKVDKSKNKQQQIK